MPTLVPNPTVDRERPGDAVTSDHLAALALAAGAGDRHATRTLIANVTPSLLRAIRGVLGARHPDVDDVAQEAAMTLIRRLPAFRRECSVVHFACRIGVLCALACRRKRGDYGRVDSVEDYEHRESDGLSPVEETVASRRRAVLYTLCGDLPEAQVEALMMQCVLGMTVEEIAATTSAPLNTVRSRLRLAKEALRDRIGADPSLVDELEVGR